jgi:putative transposase
MAWWENDRVTQRKKLIMEWLSGDFTVTELSERHDIARSKIYKWTGRYEKYGPEGLEDRSHRPHNCPQETPAYVIEEAVRLRLSRRAPMGADKVRARLLTEHSDWPVPSKRTLHNHFEKLGLVEKRKRRKKSSHPGAPTTVFDAPNSVWTADFKGDFLTRDGWRCYPLTIHDGFSRYLFACQGLDGTRSRDSKRVFTRAFQEYGLPEWIRSDNGVPFSSPHSLSRLSRLSVWWIRLGIIPELTELSSPQQNARHERMHRTLKAETAIPPAGNRAAQQRRFNEFRTYYNEVRPHEAHGQRPPASVYVPSPRPFPSKLVPLEYPVHFEVRKVSTNGGIRWHSAWINVSQLLGGLYIGLEEIASGVWAVFFGPLQLGCLHIDKGVIVDHNGSASRNPRL